jgi:RND family efflux transporter MFP subunit
VVVLALVVTGGGACRHKEEAPAETARRVRCASAEPMDVTDTLELRGTISPLPTRDAQVSAQVTGRILAILVREGDAVIVGQTLARLDDGPLVDDLHASEAALAKTDAEVKNAEATAARVRRVFEHGIAARQELDDALTRAEAARGAKGEAEATRRRAERQVERAAVRSPLRGVVVRLLRRPGELVDGTPATPIVEVADPSRLELVADVAASDLVRAEKGQGADISISALPNAAWTGTVTAVAPAVDRNTGLGAVRVELEGSPRPPIGVLGSARVRVGSSRRSVGVPAAAVRAGSGDEIEVVVCGGDGKAHVRRLPYGNTVGGRTETPGLEAGTQVAVAPVIGIADGDQLEIEK